eukprot:15352033-Ditylum_brightwellii.AAC.1
MATPLPVDLLTWFVMPLTKPSSAKTREMAQLGLMNSAPLADCPYMLTIVELMVIQIPDPSSLPQDLRH